MADTTFKDLFNEMEQGNFTSAIPAGTYDVIVTEARAELQNGNVIFVTMQVLDGPSAGKSTEVNIYIPKREGGEKAFTLRKFKEKMFGFLAYPDVRAAGQSADAAPTRIAQLELLAGVLTGKKVKADIGLRGQDAGQYANTNELNATNRPAGGEFTVPTPAPNGQAEVAPAPQAAPQPAPQAPQTVTAPF